MSVMENGLEHEVGDNNYSLCRTCGERLMEPMVGGNSECIGNVGSVESVESVSLWAGEPSPIHMLAAVTQLGSRWLRLAPDTDPLPASICLRCLTSLRAAYTFNLQCLEAQRHLALRHSREPQIPPTPSQAVLSTKSTVTRPLQVRTDPKRIRILPKLSPDAIPDSPLFLIDRPTFKPVGLTDTLIVRDAVPGLTTANDPDSRDLKPVREFHSCKKCGKRFISAEWLQKHAEKSHLEISPVKNCSLCGIAFEDSKDLKNHNLKVHFPSATDTKATCDICNKAFKNKYLLTRHNKNIHKDELKKNAPFESETKEADVSKKCLQCNSESKPEEILPEELLPNLQDYIEPSDVQHVNICGFCNKGFLRKDDLQSHEMTHGKQNDPYLCVYCEKSFIQREDLKMHQLYKHDAELLFCGHCPGSMFDNKIDLYNHLQSLHADGVILDVPQNVIYKVILQTSDDVNYLSENANIISGDNIESCDNYIDNTNIFENNISLQSDDNCKDTGMILLNTSNELVAETEDILKCSELYELNTINDRSLLIKQAENAKTTIESCKIDENITEKEDIHKIGCKSEDVNKNRTYSKKILPSSNDSLKLKGKNEMNSQTLHCKVCSKKFLKVFHLQKHMTIHKNVTPYCVACNYEATDSNTLKEHLLACKILKLRNNLSCNICGKVLLTSAGLRYHVQTHSGIRRHACDLCPRRFVTLGNLKSHVKYTHSEPHRFTCDLCFHLFNSSNDLRNHISRTHLSQRDHVCYTCGHRFKQSSHLTQHLLVHTGDKPHQCPYCSNKYTAKCSLTKHLKRNHLLEQKQTKEVEDVSPNLETLLNPGDIEFDIPGLTEGVILDDDFKDGINLVIVVDDSVGLDYDNMQIFKH